MPRQKRVAAGLAVFSAAAFLCAVIWPLPAQTLAWISAAAIAACIYLVDRAYPAENSARPSPVSLTARPSPDSQAAPQPQGTAPAPARQPPGFQTTPASANRLLILIIIAGTALRLLLAYAGAGNTDTQNSLAISNIFLAGGNVYAETPFYNYTPVWFWTIGLCRVFADFTGASLHFAIGLALTLSDLASLWIIIRIAGLRGENAASATAFFYLNPVSWLITGYHGQFETLVMLPLLGGIYRYLKNPDTGGKAALWGLATLAMAVKHLVLYEPLICALHAVKGRWKQAALYALSCAVFAAFFIPYWRGGAAGIIRNVLGYSSGVGFYGLSSFISWKGLKYLFIAGMLAYPFFLKSGDLVKKCLQGTLFFLTFSSGAAIQYFVLPIALGALKPSKAFLWYTVMASLYIAASPDNVHVPFLKFDCNMVWLAAAWWFWREAKER